MLVLSRKKNEKVRINSDITIAVIEIRGDKVRLGIEAPLNVPVHREEVFLAIQEQGLLGRSEVRYAHLYDGQRHYGTVKCENIRHAEEVLRMHLKAGGSNTGKISASEEP
jgi:carbon storage regulator